MKYFLNLKLRNKGLAVATLACMVPGQLFAQFIDECNAQLNAGALSEVLYFLNEPVAIGLRIGAGVVVNTNPGNPANYLDISEFDYHLDCSEGDIWPNCTDAGNTVEFDHNSVVTDCRDENNNPVIFQTSVVNDVVSFKPAPGQYVRNFSQQTCDIQFNVKVTAVSGDNAEKEIIELTGWGSAADTQAFCDNGLTASAASSVRFDLATGDALFRVTKSFSDDNPAPVDVHIKCNTGIPLTSSFTIDKDSTVGFVVTNYEPGELNCEIWEEPTIAGYTPDYQVGATTGNTDLSGGISDDADGCYYQAVIDGAFTCDISNDADPARFTVTKEWEYFNQGGDVIEEDVLVTISCNNQILNPDAAYDSTTNYWMLTGVLGANESLTVQVDTTTSSASCMASESAVSSGVESSDDCGWRTIPAGTTSQCTISNTVFFEGVPTLNQYGLALMALLMLGIGMLGFRKFS